MPVIERYAQFVPIVTVSLTNAVRAWLADRVTRNETALDLWNMERVTSDKNHPGEVGNDVAAGLVKHAICSSLEWGGPSIANRTTDLSNVSYLFKLDDETMEQIRRPGRVRSLVLVVPSRFDWQYEMFECVRKRFRHSPEATPVPEVLTTAVLVSVRCDNFDVWREGAAYHHRTDRKWYLSLPECRRGNFTVRIPYPIDHISVFKWTPSLALVVTINGVEVRRKEDEDSKLFRDRNVISYCGDATKRSPPEMWADNAEGAVTNEIRIVKRLS